ncbi:MAG: ABC transporter ATP-binding protein/permease, partial [Lentisphaerae bacterium]|nr:ABC transporter ATP-binding protein/permease [Lentisphaerota bacterium]
MVRAAAAVAIPFLVRLLLRDHLPSGNAQAVYLIMGVMLALVAVMCGAAFVNTKWGHILGARMETDMRADIFAHLQKLSFSYFDNTKTGHIMSRISNDLFTISEVAHHAPEDLFISFFVMAGSFTVMFSFSPSLAVIAMIPLPFMLLVGGVFQSRMRRGFRRIRERIADINSSVENSIQGIREVKSYANETQEARKFDAVNREFRAAKENMYTVMAEFHASMMFLTELYPVVIIGGGVVVMAMGRASLPDLVAFLMYIQFMLNPVHRLVGFAEQYQQGAAAFERFVEILDVVPDIVDRPGARTLTEVRGAISAEHVSFRYDTSPDWVLREINLSVSPGQTVALVGESGAGKSTLAALIPRFYEPQQGVVRIDGMPITEFTQRSLRAHVAIVQQNVFMFDASIRENILFGRPDADDAELLEAARNANILEFIRALPEGFDTLVGEHGVKLSGGQRQRVSIARAFLKNAPVLIFDEATSSLDTESENLIRRSMQQLCANRTTIIIAHRLSTVQRAHCIYVMRQGRIVEQGTHQELIDHQGCYHQLYSGSLF